MKQEKNKETVEKRRLQYSVNNAIVVVGFLVIIVLINIVAGAINSRVPMTIDLTENHVFTLSEPTKEMLAGLTEDVTVYYLVSSQADDSTTDMIISEILTQYTRASSHVKVERVNYAKNPGFLAQYAAENLSVNSLIVQGKDDATTIDSMAMGTQEYGQSYLLLESQLTNAIALVTSDTRVSVYFTKDHGETGVADFATMIQEENVTVGEISLMTTDIPEDCSILWIRAPKNDFSEEELQKIDAYLDGGGQVEVELNYQYHPQLLCQYLTEWGMVVNDDVVAEHDSSRTVQGNPFQYLVSFGEHPINQMLTNRAVVGFGASSIASVDVNRVVLTPLLATTEDAASFALQDVANGNFDSPISEGRAFLAVLSEDMETGGAIALYSSSSFLDTSVLSSESYGNRAMLVGLVNYLGHANLTGISVAPKNISTPKLVVSDKDVRNWAWICIPVIPLIVTALGIYVYIKRQSR